MGATLEKLHHRFTLLTQKSEKQDFISKYRVGRCLGNGAYGDIHEAIQSHTFRTVALKYMKKKSIKNWASAGGKRLPAEAVYLEMLDHKNIIKLIDLYEFKKKFVMVLERPLISLDLHQFLLKFGPQNDTVTSNIIRQLLSVAGYLRDNNIFHRDIKSENVLINYYTYHIRIIDFGSAITVKDSNALLGGQVGTPAFAPPEWVCNTGYRPEPTTVWTIGVVAFEVLTGTLPFFDIPHLLKGKILFPDYVSDPARRFIRGLLHKEDIDRMTINEALEDPYLVEEEPENNSFALDNSTYSKSSAYMIYENLNCTGPLSDI